MKTELEKLTLAEGNALFFVYNDIDSVYISSLVAIDLARTLSIKPVFVSFSNFSRNLDILSQSLNKKSSTEKGNIEFVKIGDDSHREQEKCWVEIENFTNKYKNFHIDDIPVGDLIIDGAIRVQDKFPSHQILVDEDSLVHEAKFFVSAYSNLVNSLNPTKAFLVETGYISMGTLKRILFRKNIPLFQLHSWSGISKIERINDLFGSELIYSRDQVDRMLSSANIKPETSETYYKNRFLGKVNTPDAKIAYSHQPQSSLENIKKDKLLKVLYLHAFKDMNHFSYLGETRLFETYLEWARYTIEKISKDTFSDWIIKIHPCAYMYGEAAYTANFIDEIIKPNRGNVRILSNEIPSAEVLKNADLIYTFDGTIAVEFACMGKVSICLGNRYWDYPFAITPKSLSEYDQMISLTKIHELPKLTDRDKVDAQKLIYTTSGMMPLYNHIGDAITMPGTDYRLLKIKESFNAINLLKSFFANIFFTPEKAIKLSSGVEITEYLRGIE